MADHISGLLATADELLLFCRDTLVRAGMDDPGAETVAHSLVEALPHWWPVSLPCSWKVIPHGSWAPLVGLPIFIVEMISPILFVSGLVEIYKSSIWTLAYHDLKAKEQRAQESIIEAQAITAPG